MMTLDKLSPCKVNLILNILGKRADGFHELETIMHPVAVCDRLTFQRIAVAVELTCNNPSLPLDSGNLVVRAAELFRERTGISDGVRIHLEKYLPLAAGLGGGSANAAITLQALNELFGSPLEFDQLHQLAGTLGSDVPFFLQSGPALATGRGEHVRPLEGFAALHGTAFLLIHPGFGISTAWAYKTLAQYPLALNGTPGRAEKLVSLLRERDARAAGAEFYNSLEAPALHKYPLLVLFQEFLREQGAWATLMSGSGSTTFAIAESVSKAESLREGFFGKFGTTHWTAIVPA